MTLSAVTAAKQLHDGDISILVAGLNCKNVADQASRVSGIKNVYISDNKAFDHAIAENLSQLITNFQNQYKFSHIIASTTSFGKNVIPRLGASLDAQPISDVISIKSENTFQRPVYAGNALSTVRSSDSVKIITVRSTSFEKAEFDNDRMVSIESIDPGENADTGMTK